MIALDNSASVSQAIDSVELRDKLSTVQELADDLSGKGFEVVITTIDGTVLNSASDLSFDSQSTNLNEILKSIQSDYEGRNLGGVLLVSDGIYNQGLSPTFSPYNFEITTLGTGRQYSEGGHRSQKCVLQ